MLGVAHFGYTAGITIEGQPGRSYPLARDILAALGFGVRVGEDDAAAGTWLVELTNDQVERLNDEGYLEVTGAYEGQAVEVAVELL